MTQLVLRPYQEDAVNQIRVLFGQGKKKALLHLATGGGKTVIFSRIMQGAAQKKKR